MDDICVRDPAIIVHNDIIYLYFTWYNPNTSEWFIAMTTTRDFIDFSEPRRISPVGYASPGNIIRHEGKWVLCYQQYRHFPHNLSLAFSDDLINWSDPVDIFNTGPENQWNKDGRVIDPYLVAADGKFFAYYTGSDRWPDRKGANYIGVAGSTDLKTWTDLTPDKPALGLDFDWEGPDGNENNCVIRHKGQWLTLYSASLTKQKIALAVSDDLIHWDKKGLCTVRDFPAQSWRYGAPFIIEELSKNNQYYMIYLAESLEKKTSFILVESNDLIHWH